jgi:hypothetical protein
MFTESNKIYNATTSVQESIAMVHGISLFRINELDIPFSSKWKRIAINVSGGADSACLTYLLCKIITDNNFDCKIDFISHVRCWTTRPWQGSIGIGVYNKLKDMFPNIINERHENFITPEIEHGVSGYIYKDPVYNEDHSGDQLQVSGFNLYTSFKYNFDAVFNGTSANPPGTNFPKKMKEREKPASEGILPDLIIHSDGKFLCHPFRFVDKAWIVAQFYYFNITDLLNLTRSCEGDVTHRNIIGTISDYRAYIPGMKVPECGTCFWCLERNWALSKLDETLELLKNE